MIGYLFAIGMSVQVIVMGIIIYRVASFLEEEDIKKTTQVGL